MYDNLLRFFEQMWGASDSTQGQVLSQAEDANATETTSVRDGSTLR